VILGRSSDMVFETSILMLIRSQDTYLPLPSKVEPLPIPILSRLFDGQPSVSFPCLVLWSS
jgi:hypothetical protein